jgi:hypothetical protein
MVTIDHSFFIGTERADVGMDDLTPMTHDCEAYDNKFTDTIRKIVIGVGPVGEAFDPPLEWHGLGKALARVRDKVVADNVERPMAFAVGPDQTDQLVSWRNIAIALTERANRALEFAMGVRPTHRE